MLLVANLCELLQFKWDFFSGLPYSTFRFIKLMNYMVKWFEYRYIGGNQIPIGRLLWWLNNANVGMGRR